MNGAPTPGAPLWVFRLFPVALFLIAVVTRLVAIGRYVTPDEAVWVYRSLQFRESLLAGDWAGTLVAGHPGVTTTWLGALGMSAQLRLMPHLYEPYSWLTKIAALTPDNVEAFKRLAIFLDGGRIAVALANSLGVVGVYWLAQRLWGWKVAMVAALLLALDPFFAGLSGLLHVDGLSATFVTLSLLTLAVGFQQRDDRQGAHNSWAWWAMSGAAAGLAILSKTPTLLLLPVAGLVLLITGFSGYRKRESGWPQLLLVRSAAWGGAFLAVIFLLFPALWVNPAGVLATVSGSANRHLEEALRETFFMGRVAYDHGPIFYPVVLLWRLSPVAWLALLPAVGLFARSFSRRETRRISPEVILLGVWIALFMLAITPAAKKFDRYILPVVPAILVLSALAWVSFARQSRKWGRWFILLLLVAHSLFWMAFAAYPLAAYNPLVGGAQTAARMLPIGWGEAIGSAGRELKKLREEAPQQRAIAGIAPALAPFFPGQTLVDGIDDPATANYVILTLGGRQLDPAGWDKATHGLNQIGVIRFGGLDQAWIFEQPNPRSPHSPRALRNPVSFGGRIGLPAYDQFVSDDTLMISARWRRLVNLAADERFTLRIAVRDDQGNVWASTETDLLNAVQFYPPDWEEDDSGVVRYRLELPPGIPPGAYDISLSLINNRTAGQLPVHDNDGSFLGVVFPGGSISMVPPEQIVSASRMQIPYFTGASWLDGRLRLLGHGQIEPVHLAGGEVSIDLFWHVPTGELPPGLHIAWQLQPAGDGASEIIRKEPLSRFDTGRWRTGETIQEKYRVPLPPSLPPGYYTLAIEPLLADGSSAGEALAFGEIQVNNFDRVYRMPEDVPVPIGVTFSTMTLKGMEPALAVGLPGESPEITFYWENHEAHGDVYTVFVHVLDEAGNIVFQADHWPGGVPTNVLDIGQIVIDRVALPIPPDLPAGAYRIRVGLYSAESGLRLPVTQTDPQTVVLAGTDSLILPVSLRVVSP